MENGSINHLEKPDLPIENLDLKLQPPPATKIGVLRRRLRARRRRHRHRRPIGRHHDSQLTKAYQASGLNLARRSGANLRGEPNSDDHHITKSNGVINGLSGNVTAEDIVPGTSRAIFSGGLSQI